VAIPFDKKAKWTEGRQVGIRLTQAEAAKRRCKIELDLESHHGEAAQTITSTFELENQSKPPCDGTLIPKEASVLAIIDSGRFRE
jgi:hypothetical protein